MKKSKETSPTRLLQNAINHQKRGDTRAMSVTLRELLEAFPDFNKGYDLLISSYRDNINELIPYLKSHLESHPDVIACYDSLWHAYLLSNKPDELPLYLNTLLIRFPEQAEPLYLLAEIYDGKGNMKLAMEYLNDAFQRSPNNWRCQNLMASILVKQGDFDRAEQYYKGSLNNQSDNPVAISGLSEIHYAKGRYQEAYDILSTYLNCTDGLNPSIIKAFIKVAPKINQETLAIAKAEEFLANHNSVIKDGITISLYGDLAKIYDRKGEYKKAFTLMHQHNKMSGSHWNEQQEIKNITSIKAHYNQETLAQAILAIPTKPSPIFIIGFPRSGTTLVEQIISSHPEVFGAGELASISRLNNQIITGANTPELYRDFITSLPQNNHAREQLIIHYLTDVQSQGTIDKPLYTDKMPSNFMHLGLIRLLFPDAPIIHCKRDPLDTCISCYFQQFSEAHSYSNDLQHLGKHYNLYLEMMAHWKACAINMLEIDYETLVANQDKVSRKIIDYCQLAWDERCLKPHEQARFVATASVEQVTQPIYNHSVGRWKNYQSDITPLIAELNRST